jgi:hypothetical protein
MAQARWARRASPGGKKAKDDKEAKDNKRSNRWGIIAAVLSASAAIATVAVSVFFSGQQIKETDKQLKGTYKQLTIDEQGQITDRYNAAITNLGSRSIDVRLGGIYALQRMMTDSPRDQPTVIAVLCAFVRDRSMPTRKPHKPPSSLRADIQAAVTVVGARNPKNDGRKIGRGFDPTATFVDFNHAQLANGELSGLNFSGADFTGANLAGAHLARTGLADAYLVGANLHGARLIRADFDGANLARADLTDADLRSSYSLNNTDLAGADLTRAKWVNNRPLPHGWVQDPRSGRLKRAKKGR